MTLRGTLVGVATGTPDGGVAIVRLSGARAQAIARALLVGDLPPPRRLALRALRVGVSNGETSAGKERAQVVSMPGPNSFTGEDVVELHVHAGEANVRQVMEAACAAGGVAAGPGDFSRRAFELGRYGLDELEGIAAAIAATTEEQLGLARRLMAGELGSDVTRLAEDLDGLRFEVESSLDFPEDVAEPDTRRWAGRLEGVVEELADWERGFEAGRRVREGIRVVLAGPPNAGKSSLFNLLLGRGRALVSAQPGTTRDYVEASVRLGPRSVVLVDTAGLRDQGADEVEAEGIGLSREQLEGADVVLWLEAADAAPDTPGPGRGDQRWIRVETKRDLAVTREGWVGISARKSEGIDELVEAILSRLGPAGGAWIGLERHRERVGEARAALSRALVDLGRFELALETVAFELQVAADRLSEVHGRPRTGPVGEDVLDAIFSRFCIGK